MLRGWLVAARVLRASVSVACADELVFKNGDRLSVTILSLIEGKLNFDSNLPGEIGIEADQRGESGAGRRSGIRSRAAARV